MNTLIIISLLCIVVCSNLGAQGSEDTYSGELARVTTGPASGEGHLRSLNDDDELGVEELSGGDNENVIHHELHADKDERRKKKGKGKRKNKQRNKITTPLNPDHTVITSGHTSALTSTQNPCTSTHLGFCIHGFCKYMEGLREPVCICMKGYDGARCGIQTLGAVKPAQSDNTELVQTVLVVIAVVLSVISCCAILLMICVHYRSHKNFLASYIGTGSEQEKLQKPVGDVVV
ncbi:proheparin-binding EGF-like growth factor [Cyprinodon tularosa]|uniref:proheparin-binding EGF-like growth factor n=1 Tax=Cyprinodon tularosa TaxID=77115 RepID=UPI0018E21FEE|nr:proheparin-binding EGF-like growth factor [Cyprinodon tularosa]